MNWPFGKARSARKEKAPPLREKDIPLDEERRGPAPPPPRTAHAPGVSVYGFDAIPSQHLLRLDQGCGGFFLEGEERNPRSAALLVLWAGLEPMDSADAAAAQGGDVLIWTAPALADQSPPGALSLSPLEELSRTSPQLHQDIRSDLSLSLEEVSRTSPRPQHHIRRDDLGGKAIPGITGLRALAHLPAAGLAVLRLGPPPTARWAFRGVRTIAVFSGKITLVDGEDARLVRAGSLAVVDDPSATLYLEAGNDAALAVALATSGFVAALS